VSPAAFWVGSALVSATRRSTFFVRARPKDHALFNLLSELDAARIHFTLARHRSDTVLVILTLPGERVEVDVFDDGHMEVSRFRGNEAIVGGIELVSALIRENEE
jgi:hypothetical protein